MWRAVHWVSDDPGGSDSGCAGGFSRDAAVAIEKPDGGGVFGTNTPNVIKVEKGWRMYYTLIGPTPENPLGCNDYTSATSEIRSAFSSDGHHWAAEDGVRLAPHTGGAELRVVSPDVVPLDDNGQRYRMYYEGVAEAGDEARHDAGIRSAISVDGGLQFAPEPGWRFKPSGAGSVNSPRVLPLRDGLSHRMYASLNGPSGAGIISAISTDGGLTFAIEDGVRIAKETAYERHSVFAPEVVCVGDGSMYRMYYAAIPTPDSAFIMTASSEDGLHWRKEELPVIAPGGQWDRVKASEMCLMELPEGKGFRILYEACDGSSEGKRGIWRVATATAWLSSAPKL
eukprot:COSAG02_NODE_42_length_46522_cov_109.704478_42_plen_340_part_00